MKYGKFIFNTALIISAIFMYVGLVLEDIYVLTYFGVLFIASVLCRLDIDHNQNVKTKKSIQDN